jgi:hypothetical protein
MANEREIAEILKEALRIVDKLAKMDADGILANDDEMDELENLIEKAKKLTKNRLFKLS